MPTEAKAEVFCQQRIIFPFFSVTSWMYYGRQRRSQRRHHWILPLLFASVHLIDDFITGEYFIDEFGELPDPTMFTRPLKWVLIKSIDEKIELRLVEAFGNGGICHLFLTENNISILFCYVMDVLWAPLAKPEAPSLVFASAFCLRSSYR